MNPPHAVQEWLVILTPYGTVCIKVRECLNASQEILVQLAGTIVYFRELNDNSCFWQISLVRNHNH